MSTNKKGNVLSGPGRLIERAFGAFAAAHQHYTGGLRNDVSLIAPSCIVKPDFHDGRTPERAPR